MDSKFILGIKQVDDEHEKMFNLCQTIKGCLDSVDCPDLLSLVAELNDYALTHLKNEELLIQFWDGFSIHREQHSTLCFRLDELFPKIHNSIGVPDCTVLIQELYDLVYDWLCTHILIEDAQFVPFLKGIGYV